MTASAINLSHLNLDQLRELNRSVVQHINMIHRERAAKALGRFKTGDKVRFTSDKYRSVITGYVERINQKTITVRECTAMGEHGGEFANVWRVSPSLCRIVE